MTFKLTALASVFSEPFDLEPEAESFVQFKVDPLVLSCCSYRHNDPSKENYDPILSFTSLNQPSKIYDKVNEIDYE